MIIDSTGKKNWTFQLLYSLISPLPVSVSAEFDSNVLEQWSCPDFLKRCCSSTPAKLMSLNKNNRSVSKEEKEPSVLNAQKNLSNQRQGASSTKETKSPKTSNSASVKQEENVTPVVAVQNSPCNQLPHAPKTSNSASVKQEENVTPVVAAQNSNQLPHAPNTSNSASVKEEEKVTPVEGTEASPPIQTPVSTASSTSAPVSPNSATSSTAVAIPPLGKHPLGIPADWYDDFLDLVDLSSPPEDANDVEGAELCGFCQCSYKGQWYQVSCGHVFHKLCLDNILAEIALSEEKLTIEPKYRMLDYPDWTKYAKRWKIVPTVTFKCPFCNRDGLKTYLDLEVFDGPLMWGQIKYSQK